MRSLYEVAGGEALQWVKPKWFKRQYELRAGEEVVATLARSSGSSAVGEWSGGRYRFFQQGWFNPQILVGDDSATDANTPLGTFARRGGVLTLADGHTLSWVKPSFWKSRRVWSNGAAPLVKFDPASGYASSQVMITPEGAQIAELPLLLLLGQYLIVRSREESDAASAATTATIVASS